MRMIDEWDKSIGSMFSKRGQRDEADDEDRL